MGTTITPITPITPIIRTIPTPVLIDRGAVQVVAMHGLVSVSAKDDTTCGNPTDTGPGSVGRS